MAHARFTVSLPPDVASDLNHLSQVLGISRSAIVADVLGDAFRALVPVVDHYALPEAGGSGRRLRGASAAEIRRDFAYLREVASSVDPRHFELTLSNDSGTGDD